MADLPSDILARPAAQSVRLVALGYLDDAARSLARLEDPEDAEALHDFRVAVRRLRTTLRAYGPQFQHSVRRKFRTRLRDITEVTKRGRDAEAELAWLRPLAKQLAPHQRVGLRWLVELIERGRTRALEDAMTDLPRSFSKVEQQLRKALAVCPTAVPRTDAAPEIPFATVARDALSEHVKQLDRLLAAVRAADEHEDIHRTRIAGKRLRYLLEPLAERLPGGADLVQDLKSLQDQLGELYDIHTLDAVLRGAVEEAAAERARRLYKLAAAAAELKAARRRNENPGLLAVARRLHTRRDALFATLKTRWLGPGDEFTPKVEAAIEGLAAGPGEAARRIPWRRPAAGMSKARQPQR